MEINSDGTLTLQAAVLTAEQVDELLMELEQARRDMSPEVPLDPVVGMEMSLVEDAECMVPGRTEDGIEMVFRHPGFGWLIFTLSDANASTLGQALHDVAGDTGHYLDTSTTDGEPEH